MYGLLAEEMKLSRDKLSISFRLNREAKFSNGDSVLAKDTVFSYETLISGDGSILFKNYWADIKDVSIVSDREVKFTFRKKKTRLHFIIASMPIFSEKWGKVEKASRILLQIIQLLVGHIK